MEKELKALKLRLERGFGGCRKEGMKKKKKDWKSFEKDHLGGGLKKGGLTKWPKEVV